MRIYQGRRIMSEGVITWRGEWDSHARDTLTASPRPGRRYAGGHNWGNGGFGCMQLAYDLLLDASADRDAAGELYRLYCVEVVSRLPCDGWTLTQQEIIDWLHVQPRVLIV